MTKKINGVLLIYNHPIKDSAATISEHVESFKKYSQEKFYAINTEYNFPSKLNRYAFKAIIFHYSLFAPKQYLLPKRLLRYLERDSISYRIAFGQDEYQYCSLRFDFINKYRISCIYTLLEPSEFKKVYEKYTSVKRIHSTLTGYVSPELINIAKQYHIPYNKRTIDVSYRARHLEFFMGAGAQEKMEIGRRFLEYAVKYNLRCDIKVSNLERFNGLEWHKFLANSKAVLGVEAGVSIFDLEDKVRLECAELVKENPNIDFKTVHDLVLKKWENNVYYRQISPRIFEAAALKVVQILFEGKYSNILKPYEHYIPLKKDFSNIDDVVELLKNDEFINKITENAYNDLIASNRFTYKKFIEGVDEELSSISKNGFVNYNLDSFFNSITKKQERFRKIRLFFSGRKFLGKKILKAIFLPK